MQTDRKLKLLILDRDGVINHNSSNHILDWENFIFKDRVLDAFVLMKQLDCDICICTKQRSISRCLITREKVDRIMRYMNAVIEDSGGRKIDTWYVEPLQKDKSMILPKILKNYDVDPGNVLLIDDSETEIESARRLGIHTLKIQDGFDLYDAIQCLLSGGENDNNQNSIED